MLVINKTSVTVHHKKVKGQRILCKKKDGLFFGTRHDIDI